MELFKLLGRIVIDNTEANKAINDTTKNAFDSESKMVSSFKKIGAAVATYFAVDKIIEFGKGCIQAAADANAANSQFSQVFGELEKDAKSSLSGIAKETGIVETRMKGSYTQIAAFAKTSGMDTEAALGLSNRAMVAVADSAAFYDRTLEDTTESLQSFLKGNFENDAALGLSCTETTRNAAANKLYGKSFKDLSESQKQLTLLQMVEDANKASGALGQAARESNTWTNQTGNLKQAFVNFQAVLGQPILQTATNIVGGLAEKVSSLAQRFSEGKNPVQFLVDKVSVFLKWCKDVGSYVASTFQPTIDNLKNAFTKTKDVLQPLIDKFTSYVTKGDLAKGVTDGIKTAADLLAGAFEIVSGLVDGVASGFESMVQWGKENETAIQMIAIAVGTLTAAIGAYNIAQAIKNAGGIVEIAQLGILQIQLWALSAAETAHSIASGIAATATTAFGAAMSFLTSPITLVIVAIGAVIAIGVLLYKNWDTVKEKCSQLGKKLASAWESIKTACGNAIKTVINFFKELPGKIWNWLSKSIDKLKTWASNVGTKAKEAGTKFLNTVVNFFKELPGKVWTWLKNTVSKVTAWTSDMVSKGKAAAQKMLTAVVSKIKEMPGKIKSVGLDIVKGIGNGITNGLGWIKKKIKSWVGNVTKFIKKLFGIKSPSTVMRDEVGRYLAEGVAVGITANADKAESASEKLAKNILDSAQSKLDTFKTFNDMTLAEETGFWDAVRVQLKEGTDARLQADQKYYDAKKSINEKVVEAEETLQDSLAEIYQKLADRKSEILGTFSLFDEYTDGNATPKTAGQMLNALDSQIAALEVYDDAMATLESRIGGSALFEELASMGIGALSQIQQINNMTDIQLKMYADKYAKRAELASKMAEEELSVETFEATQKAYQTFADACGVLGVEVVSETSAMQQGVTNALDKIKQAFETFQPKMKMPHFKIEGTLDIEAGSVPSVAVEWYKKAMSNAAILNKPTIFGYSASSGKYLGAGEAGNEVVAGEQTLMQMIQGAVATQNNGIVAWLQKVFEILAQYFPQMLDALESPMAFDSNSMAAALAVPMNRELGKISSRKERGR